LLSNHPPSYTDLTLHSSYFGSCPRSFLKANLGGQTPAEFDALTEEKNTLAAELEKTKGELATALAKIEVGPSLEIVDILEA
jgi:hypothetical protein